MSVKKLSECKTQSDFNQFVYSLKPTITTFGGRKFCIRDEKDRRHSYSLNQILNGIQKLPYNYDFERNLIDQSNNANVLLEQKSKVVKIFHKIRHRLGVFINKAETERKFFDIEAMKPRRQIRTDDSSSHSSLKSSSSSSTDSESDRDDHDVGSHLKVILSLAKGDKKTKKIKRFISKFEKRGDLCDLFKVMIDLKLAGELPEISDEAFYTYYFTDKKRILFYAIFTHFTQVDQPDSTFHLDGLLTKVLEMGLAIKSEELIKIAIEKGAKTLSTSNIFDMLDKVDDKAIDLFLLLPVTTESTHIATQLIDVIASSEILLTPEQRDLIKCNYPDAYEEIDEEHQMLLNGLHNKEFMQVLKTLIIYKAKDKKIITDCYDRCFGFLIQHFPKSNPLSLLHALKYQNSEYFIRCLLTWNRKDIDCSSEMIDFILDLPRDNETKLFIAALIRYINTSPYVILQEHHVDFLEKNYPEELQLLNRDLDRIRKIINEACEDYVLSVLQVLIEFKVLGKEADLNDSFCSLLTSKPSFFFHQKFEEISNLIIREFRDTKNENNKHQFLSSILELGVLLGHEEIVKSALLEGACIRKDIRIGTPLIRNFITEINDDISDVIDSFLLLPADENSYELIRFIMREIKGKIFEVTLEQISRFYDRFPDLAKDLSRQSQIFHVLKNGFEGSTTQNAIPKPSNNAKALIYTQLELHDILSITDDSFAYSSEVIFEFAREVGFIIEDFRSAFEQSFYDIDMKSRLFELKDKIIERLSHSQMISMFQANDKATIS